MFIKRVVILSGNISGSLKVESIGNNCSCLVALSALDAPCHIVVKVGDKPIVVNKIASLKNAFRVDNFIDGGTNIACLIIDEQENVIARGKTCKAVQYDPIIYEYNKYISAQPLKQDIKVEKATVELADKIAEVIGTRANDDEGINAEIVEQPLNIELQDIETLDDNDGCNIACAAVLRSVDDSREPFFIKVGDRLSELFTQYPHDKQLEQIVYSSEWVRVEYDDSNYYVVGLIKEDGAPLFICYGVPVDSKESYKSDCSHCEWLPLNREDMDGAGYWVLYQDANTGETLT